ncbi:NAD(P)/FAD-dependent oxidoreductase [Streptomyces sp. NPDC058867]|uniref:NAD(P)/FAD-dependent oxidoreductase n=1 Tax=unclassified Streptomyces TaxID=2593676 RepID=UPI003684A3C8
MTRSVVIVGGGVAGVGTAAALRTGGFDGELTLVDAGEFPYDRPPLSKDYLAGSKDLRAIALQPEQWYAEQRVRLVNRTVVTRLWPAEGKVELSSGGLLSADRVVLATGGGAARPPIAGADSERVHVLRTADDADRLRSALLPGARVLVVGAGLIGAETASTAVRLGCEVTLVDPVPVPIAFALGPELAAWLHGLHTVHGIASVPTAVEWFADRGPDGIDAQFACDTEPRRFDAVLLGVGMVPSVELAQASGLEVDRGIVVDRGQVTSNPSVLAVGDPARVRDGGHLLPRVEHWEAAQQDGARAAATILGKPQPPTTAPWFWTDRHGRHVEGVGHIGHAEHTVVRGSYNEPSFAVFGLARGQVVAAASVDDSAAVRAARRMIDRGLSVDAARLADPTVNLRSLLRG